MSPPHQNAGDTVDFILTKHTSGGERILPQLVKVLEHPYTWGETERLVRLKFQ